MANHKSAKKRAKQTIEKTARNKSKLSKIKTFTKKVRAALASKEKTQAVELMRNLQSLLAKVAKTSALKKRTASRKTSRLAKQVAAI